MLGFRLFLHALRMILTNLPQAIRVSIPALIMTAALNAVMLRVLSLPGAGVRPDGRMHIPFESMSAGLVLTVIGVFLLTSLAMLWTAVAWHRYILIEEEPSAIGPRWDGASIWRYLGASIVLVVYVLMWAILFAILSAIAAYFLSGMMSPRALGWFITFVVGVPVAIVFYRASPVLPSAALGERIRVREAIRATAGANGAVIMLGVLSVLGAAVFDLPAPVLASTAPLLGFVWQVFTGWLTALAGISVMTTLYGHFIEKRALNV